jgi:hypothetical protein
MMRLWQGLMSLHRRFQRNHLSCRRPANLLLFTPGLKHHETKDVRAIEAQHPSDYAVRSASQLLDAEWHSVKYAEIDKLLEDSTNKRYTLYAKIGTARHTVYLHNLDDNIWSIISTTPPDEKVSELPDSDLEPKHITAHINAALGTTGTGTKWRFKKCLEADEFPKEVYDTDQDTSRPVERMVLLYVCEREDGTIFDVSLPSKAHVMVTLTSPSATARRRQDRKSIQG